MKSGISGETTKERTLPSLSSAPFSPPCFAPLKNMHSRVHQARPSSPGNRLGGFRAERGNGGLRSTVTREPQPAASDALEFDATADRLDVKGTDKSDSRMRRGIAGGTVGDTVRADETRSTLP